METENTGRPALPLAPTDLDAYGLLPHTGLGVQFDISSVIRKAGSGLVNGYLCDHNCTISYRGKPTGGHYNCPASFSENRGAIAASIAPADQVLRGIDHVIAAGRQEQRKFLAGEFDHYATRFRLPPNVADIVRERVAAPSVEIALFGGSPEAHPEILDLVSGLRAACHDVHITMTGRKLMRNPALLSEMAVCGVSVVALSLDDLGSATELSALLSLEMSELYDQWKRVPPIFGQRQKVYEAIYTARLLETLPEPRPGLLFNIALHPGNMSGIDEMLQALTSEFESASLNPFPVQSAFERRDAALPDEYILLFSQFIEEVLEVHKASVAGRQRRWSLVPRMHYWLALQAAVEAYEQPQKALSGWDTWRCYRSAGSGRYVQIAGTGEHLDIVNVDHAGGHVGCFWNDSLADAALPPVWSAEPAAVATYLEGRPARARRSANPCAGCLFPRLVGDMVSLECGLDPQIREAYLAKRLQHAGF